MARNVDPLISVPRALVEPQGHNELFFFCQKNQSRQSLMIEFSYSEVKLLHPYSIYCAPDFVLDAQSYPILLVDIFMTFILQAGVSKRHQKGSQLSHRSFEELTPRAAAKWSCFQPPRPPPPSPQTGELLWCACFTFVPSIENVSYFSYIIRFDEFFWMNFIFINWFFFVKIHGHLGMGFKVKYVDAKRGTTLVCLLHLCSFYWECEIFFIHALIWRVFLRALILLYRLIFFVKIRGHGF